MKSSTATAPRPKISIRLPNGNTPGPAVSPEKMLLLAQRFGCDSLARPRRTWGVEMNLLISAFRAKMPYEQQETNCHESRNDRRAAQRHPAAMKRRLCNWPGVQASA